MKLFVTRLSALGLFLAIIGLAGCGDSAKKTTLKGKVTYNGQPLANALIVVNGADNVSIGGSSDGQGNYEVVNPPLGAVKIQVTEPPERMMKGPLKPGLAKIGKPGTGIPYDMKAGDQKFDLAITD
ncbi:carboxypeptidase-like regulatory domain-containing protein [Zavarzinella formosa]|uniref:carboxypeptidase-like regulatory domain-containing protein n=1 Tax=Zavarzinella formosa TaxID=360055 RepID=UPI00031E229A|nr:carboxypeptidase-like regulatory domain-containing protein [Zavarzinella formosa]